MRLLDPVGDKRRIGWNFGRGEELGGVNARLRVEIPCSAKLQIILAKTSIEELQSHLVIVSYAMPRHEDCSDDHIQVRRDVAYLISSFGSVQNN